MARKQSDIFKKIDKESLFVIGETPQERARILYIRGNLKPSQVIKRLVEWGDAEIPADTLRTWISENKWKQIRNDFKRMYDKSVAEARAKVIADRDVSNEDQVREVYSNLSGEIMNAVGQRLKFSKPPGADAPILTDKEAYMLSETIKNMMEVHFRALGVPELSVVDPTQGQEGITLLTKRDMERLESGKQKQ